MARGRKQAAPGRTVVEADALDWLRTAVCEAIVTSMPDAAEINMTATSTAYAKWLTRAATYCMGAAPIVVFYQTDRRGEQQWLSKVHRIMDASRAAAMPLRWHKIVLRHEPNIIDLRRPGYSHMLAFSRAPLPYVPSADVIGPYGMVYSNGMDIRATHIALEWVAGAAHEVTDPFCGHGTVLALANAMGMDAVGVDNDPEQCTIARTMQLSRISYAEASEPAATIPQEPTPIGAARRQRRQRDG